MNVTMNSSFYTSVSNCIICLEEVRCRGKLSVCKHWFCFGCILEWSKNTNTCPVCKTRFRSISKVHLSPLKSPPTKVRVPDKDQRVWNDDDDAGITEELLYDIQNELRENIDDDYEPTTHSSSDNPYQDDLDEYDLEDSFIDDSSLTQPASQTPERFLLAQELIDHAVVTRSSPYMLRRLYGRGGTSTRGSDVMQEIYAINDLDEDTIFEDVNSDESYASSSTDSSDSGTDQEDDESNTRTMRTRSSRNTRSQALGRNTASLATRNSGSQAPMRNRRSLRSQAPRTTRSQAPTSNTRTQAPRRSTRSQARHQNEQTRNQRRREDQLIAQSIQETGSSGWLNTRSTNEQSAAARAVAQTANHNSSPCRTRRNTSELSHGHARREHNFRSKGDGDDDADAYESDQSGTSPVHPSGSRVQEDAHPKKSRFSRIRGPSLSESELSEIVDLSPTRPNAQQAERKSTENDNRNSTRNMQISLPSSSREIDDDPTYNPSEVKKWKRIRNGNKGKGKEKKPLSRSLFPSVDDPDYIPNLSDQLPSKCSQLDSVRNRNVGECQKSSSVATRLTRSGVRRLENSSYPEWSASLSMWSLATSGTNRQFDLRKQIQGNQFASDGDDDDACDNDTCDDYVRETDAQHIRKRRRNVATVIRMPRDYKDDDSDDDKQSEDKGKRKIARTNRSHYEDDDDDDDRSSRGKEPRHITVSKSNDDDDDEKHVSKRKKKETTVSRSPSCRDDVHDDDMDDATLNILKPTPQPDKKRSLFTRRRHRTINEQFDDPLNEQDHPRFGRILQALQDEPLRFSSKTKPGNDENDKNSTNVTLSKGSGLQLVKTVSNNDFMPELASVSSNHMNGPCSSNKPAVTRTRKRIKMYDSDSD